MKSYDIALKVQLTDLGLGNAKRNDFTNKSEKTYYGKKLIKTEA